MMLDLQHNISHRQYLLVIPFQNHVVARISNANRTGVLRI